jgi:hypothetical protein
MRHPWDRSGMDTRLAQLHTEDFTDLHVWLHVDWTISVGLLALLGVKDPLRRIKTIAAHL